MLQSCIYDVAVTNDMTLAGQESLKQSTLKKFGHKSIHQHAKSWDKLIKWFLISQSNNFHYYTFNSLSLFWLAQSVRWIFLKSAPGTSSNCRLYNNHVKDTQGHGQSYHVCPRCMISRDNHVTFARFVLLAVLLTVVSIFFFNWINNRTIVRFGFCDIQNNQGLGKGSQP